VARDNKKKILELKVYKGGVIDNGTIKAMK
jgi:hypothetical protein